MATVTRIPSKNLFVPHELGNLSVIHNGREFCVIDEEGESYKVAKHYLPKELREISPEHLKKCLKVAYLAISCVGEEFSIKLNARQDGRRTIARLLWILAGKICLLRNGCGSSRNSSCDHRGSSSRSNRCSNRWGWIRSRATGYGD